MRDSTKANLKGIFILLPFLITMFLTILLSPPAAELRDRVLLLIPLCGGFAITVILFCIDTRFRHWFRAVNRNSDEFNENYRYDPDDEGESEDA